MAINTTLTRTATTTWEFDPAHSTIEFKVKHLMVSTVRGRFSGVQGTISGDVDSPTEARVDVVIDAATVDTRNEQRDGHLRSADFLDVENFPTITFKSTRVERAGGDKLKVSGDLTIHGVTKEVTLDVEITGVGKSPYGTIVAGLEARTSINRKDFGLTYNMALETGGWMVGDELKVEIDLEAVKQQ